ncbi:MAG: hypothetical protein H6884_02165 [Rhodobiaceae bacterium]|nr:hypothetical protein [Rhodobiaceae bacterium]
MSATTATAASMQAPTRGEVTVFGVFSALMKKKKWIFLPTLLATLAAVAFVMVTPPRYLATTTIIVEPQESPFTRPQTQTERLTVDRETVASQVQIIKSVDVARTVIDKLKLAERPEFNPELRPGGLLDAFTALVGLGRGEGEADKAVLREYYDHLTTYTVADTHVIVVEFWSADDQLSAAAANAISDAYLSLQLETTVKSTAEASNWLERQISDLRSKVAEAERKVELFRTENGLFTTGGNARTGEDPGTTLAAQQLSELSTQLSQARAQRSDAQARARMIRELLDSGRSFEAREVFDSGLIQRLQEERVRLGAQIAELSSTLLPGHPRMRELNAQLTDLDRQMRKEVEKIARGLENDAAVAAAREQQLQKNIDALKSTVAVANESEVQLRALERDAKSQRDLLSTYLARYREAAARNDNQLAPAEARVVSPATVPLEPYFPSKTRIPLMAAIAAFVMASAVIMTTELAAAYSLSGAALAESLKLSGAGASAAPAGRREPVLDASETAKPEVVGADADTDATRREPVFARDVTDAPEQDRAPIAAAMRRAREGGAPATARSQGVAANDASKPGREVATVMKPPAKAVVRKLIDWRPGEGDQPCLLVTAAGNLGHVFEEAVALGRTLAAAGMQAIVVDTASGAGLAASLLGEEPELGMFDLLAGAANFDEVMFRDPRSSLHLIAPGHGVGDGADAQSESLSIILPALAQAYDTVILVSPPVYAATLAQVVDETVVLQPQGAAGDLAGELSAMLSRVATGPVNVASCRDCSPARPSVAAVG